MIAPRRGGRRDVTETEETGSGEGAPVDTQGEQGAEGPTNTPKGLQKLEPMDWILLTQLLEMTMWEKDKNVTPRCKKERQQKKKREETKKKKRQADPKVDEKGRATLDKQRAD